MTVINSDTQILYFSKLMLDYELHIKNKKCLGFNIKNKELKQFLKNKSINLDWESKPYDVEDKNHIIFTSHNSICVDFIRHIRNAFAHGNIFIDKNCLILRDFYNKKLSMSGRISYKLLEELLELMYKTRK